MKTKLLTTVVCSFMLLGQGCSSIMTEKEETEYSLHTIAQGELYGGGREGIAKQNSVISTKMEWDNLKAKMNSVNTVTELFTENEIDFTKYQVLAVFDEIKSSGGWSIDITDITEYADSIVIDITNLKTGNMTTVITQPFYIVKIPASNKEIIFNYLKIKENEATEIPFTEYLIGELCQWTNLKYDKNIIVINNKTEMEKYVSCTNGSFTEIDFSEQSLLLVSGGTTSGIRYISKQLKKIEPDIYRFDIDITLNMTTHPNSWVVAVLISKISEDAVISLNISQHH